MCATLMSARAALEALVADLVVRNQFIERPVAGRPSREILLAFGLGKGERQSSCTAVLACIQPAESLKKGQQYPFWRIFVPKGRLHAIGGHG